jgi:hypothetical protein
MVMAAATATTVTNCKQIVQKQTGKLSSDSFPVFYSLILAKTRLYFSSSREAIITIFFTPLYRDLARQHSSIDP